MKLPKYVLIPTENYDSDIYLHKEKYGRKEWSIVKLFQKPCALCDNVGSYGFGDENYDVNFCINHMAEFKIYKKSRITFKRKPYDQEYAGTCLKFKNWREPTKREEKFYEAYYNLQEAED